jgi:hypothetical protein
MDQKQQNQFQQQFKLQEWGLIRRRYAELLPHKMHSRSLQLGGHHQNNDDDAHNLNPRSDKND